MIFIFLAQNIEFIRISENISKTELRRRLGISRQAIQQYELGEVTPSLNTLISISNMFNYSLDELVFDDISTGERSRECINYAYRELTNLLEDLQVQKDIISKSICEVKNTRDLLKETLSKKQLKALK